jgi:hypothetical protein
MSLLSDTRDTPRTVWALVQLLAAHDGELERNGVWGWMDPFDTGKDDQGRPKAGNALDQTIGAASSLGLVDTDAAAGTVTLAASDLPDDLAGFGDWVHNHLARVPANHPDRVVLETLAWFVASFARNKGTAWVRDHNRDSLAEAINTALLSDSSDGAEDNRFNTSKWPRWREWVGFMGLGLEAPGTLFYPYPTTRLQRELEGLGNRLGFDHEIDAAPFLTAVAETMPYLDGGTLFEQAARRIGWHPNPWGLSTPLSVALRDLHEEGHIRLRMYGDTRDAFTLSPDTTSALKAIRTLTILAREGSND